jgi:hypothetical protein
MRAHWKIWTNATTEQKALRVANRVAKKLAYPVQELAVEPYSKGGYLATFVTSHPAVKWSEFIFEVIELAQRIGRFWTLCGDVRDQLDGWSNESCLSGVTSAQVLIYDATVE